jgi:hypothetical protein
MRPRLFFSVFVVLTLCAISPAQDRDPDLMPDKPAHNPALPTITFQFEFPGATPGHYAISVDATGRAAY